jgi:2-polyprenyl-3-methyl-5-hydroxy-6-metoxy-1,4-benzoquinol methylase
MSQELIQQKDYWDKEVTEFDSIYSHGKSKFSNWIDATFRWDMYARFDYTMKHAQPIEGYSFLDVGCGTGRYALELARRGARQVVGIDIAEKMVRVCEARAREQGVSERCGFVVGDLVAYSPASRLDIGIGIGLFDYVRDPLPVLSKMHAAVKDRAIMSFPRLWTWRAPVRRVRLALRGCDVFFYTQERIDQVLKQAGFSRYDSEQIGQLYCVTAYV